MCEGSEARAHVLPSKVYWKERTPVSRIAARWCLEGVWRFFLILNFNPTDGLITHRRRRRRRRRVFSRMERLSEPPPCPFEAGGGVDKINFPDVRDVLPFRGARRRKVRGRTGLQRHAEEDEPDEPDDEDDRINYGGDEDGGLNLALEGLDVEEMRARELANCTIDVLSLIHI